jgi:hypothetical protein
MDRRAFGNLARSPLLGNVPGPYMHPSTTPGYGHSLAVDTCHQSWHVIFFIIIDNMEHCNRMRLAYLLKESSRIFLFVFELQSQWDGVVGLCVFASPADRFCGF